MEGIIPLGTDLIEAASVTCALAFMDDPYTQYTIPQAEQRSNLHYGFEYYLRLVTLSGATMRATSSNCEGIAVWQDSLKKEPFSAFWRSNPLLPFRCGWRYIVRELFVNRLADKIKKKYAPKHHVYLALLAVRPDSQSKGYASKLLNTLLEELSINHLPCYLETQNMKNVSMYQRFGFKLVHQIKLKGADLPLYFMLREGSTASDTAVH